MPKKRLLFIKTGLSLSRGGAVQPGLRVSSTRAAVVLWSLFRRMFYPPSG